MIKQSKYVDDIINNINKYSSSVVVDDKLSAMEKINDSIKGILSLPSSMLNIIESPTLTYETLTKLLEEDNSEEAKIYAYDIAKMALIKHQKGGGDYVGDVVKLRTLAEELKKHDISKIAERSVSKGKEIIESFDYEIQELNNDISDFFNRPANAFELNFEKLEEIAKTSNKDIKSLLNTLSDTAKKLIDLRSQGRIDVNGYFLDRRDRIDEDRSLDFKIFHKILNMIRNDGKVGSIGGKSKKLGVNFSINSLFLDYKELEIKAENLSKKIISIIESKSTISEKEAEIWANSQSIDNEVVKALKGYYNESDIRKDMAEFYRLSNGKVKAFDIKISNGSKRAHTLGVGNLDEKPVIYLGDKGLDKRVLWHEMAHHIETDVLARSASRSHIMSRSEDGMKLHKLIDLTGNKNYTDKELAIKDGFFHPYIGKIYEGGAGELFSMVIENFSTPVSFVQNISKDKESFAFVIGFLTRRRGKMERAFDLILTEYINIASKNKGMIDDLYEKSKDGFSKIPKIDPSFTNQNWLSHVQFIAHGRTLALIYDKVFSKGNRKVKGYKLVEIDSGGKIKLLAIIPSTDRDYVMFITGFSKYITEYSQCFIEPANAKYVIECAIKEGIVKEWLTIMIMMIMNT